MPRRPQNRKIAIPPIMQGFKPFGIPKGKLENVILQIDEYEAFRLLDYEGLTQEQAAEQMAVSRPTLTRIYENARKSIAKAFVEGKMIIIEGGNIEFGQQWLRCRRCHRLINGLQNHKPCLNCKHYGASELYPITLKKE